MLGHDEAAAVVERDLLEAEQLHAAQVDVEIAAEPQRALGFLLDLVLEIGFARQAEAGQAGPALVLGEAENLAVAGFGNGLAELRRQHVAALLAPRREALPAVNRRRFPGHVTPCPFRQALNSTGQTSPLPGARNRADRRPRRERNRVVCPMDSLSSAGRRGRKGEITGRCGKTRIFRGFAKDNEYLIEHAVTHGICGS